MGWFDDAIRSFFATLDGVVYSFLKVLYQLFLDLAHVNILDNKTISTFYSKIYVLLGLFMLVKVSFSFINYIVNPDSFLDKQKGAHKIFINIILTLTMLTVTPFVFAKLYQVQDAILEDNVIPRFFLGHTSDVVTDLTYYMDESCVGKGAAKAASQGDFLSILSFRAFYRLNTSSFDESDPDFKMASGIYCAGFAEAKVSNYLIAILYKSSGTKKNLEPLGDDTQGYYIDYKIFISTATGVFICLLLLSFCFDIAVRSIKLGFLELIAPIPIVSYIDPQKGKDGMFSKWLKELGRTWADLFIRLSAVFLAIFVIGLVANNSISFGDHQSGKFWIELFVIIGALMFAKKLPDLIEKLFGFKLSGSFQLNPFKKIQDNALFGKQALGVGTGLAAASLAGATNFATRIPAIFNKNNWAEEGKDGKMHPTIGRGLGRIGMLVGSSIAGATSAGRRAFLATSKDGKIGSSISKAHKEAMFAKQQREDLGRQGSTMGGRIAADLARNVGVFNQAQRDTLRFAAEEQEIQIEENRINNAKNKEMSGYQEYSSIVDKMNEQVDKDSTVKNLKQMQEAMAQENKYYEYDDVTHELKKDDDGNLIKTQAAKNLETNLSIAREVSLNKLLEKDSGGKFKNVAMGQWQERLGKIVEENKDKMDPSVYTVDGLTRDDKGKIKGVNKDAKKDADTQVAYVEAKYAQDEKKLDARKKALAVEKQSLEIRGAAADNKARPVTSGGQPEGWTPSPALNGRGPLGGQYGTHMQDRFDDTH